MVELYVGLFMFGAPIWIGTLSGWPYWAAVLFAMINLFVFNAYYYQRKKR